MISVVISRYILVSLMAAMTAGCIYVPELGPARKSRLDAVQSDAAGGNKLKVGRSSREEILKTLGKPYRQTKRQLAIGYVYFRTYGHTVGMLGGPCGPSFGIQPDARVDELWLAFDETGTLRKVHPFPFGDQSKWSDFISDVPDEDQETNPTDFPRYP